MLAEYLLLLQNTGAIGVSVGIARGSDENKDGIG